MKIFGWLQCKLGNNNGGMLKESVYGNACCLSMKPSWNNQQDYLRPNNNGSKRKLQTKHEFEDYLNGSKAQDSVGDATTEESFPGFLAIGTLNMESMVSEPGTPTFGFPAFQDNNMEEEDYELKLINEELEKLYKVESENEWFGESKRTTEEEAKAFHPLEGYLFASSYDFSASNGTDTYQSVHVEKKQDELKLAKYKTAANPMRKIMDAFQPTSKKFHKIKQVFRKKVHPEELRGVKESKSYNKSKINTGNGGSKRDTYHKNPEVYQNAIMKTLKKSNDSNVEHWIKSDADFT
ncbi:hypothetical protein V2J09_015805 [Rumex salicifolius]